MRLNLPTPLRTRPGDHSKDARMVNCYAEVKNKQATARKRGGALAVGVTVTDGQGLSDTTDFTGRIFSISGDLYTILGPV